MAILFADGHNVPQVVTVPCVDGILSLEHWVNSPQVSNYLIKHTDMSHVGVRRMVSKAVSPPWEIHTIFYMSQSVAMPVNQALLSFCTAAENHTLLRGNVLVVKSYQNPLDRFGDLTERNIDFCGDLVGRYVMCITNRLRCTDRPCALARWLMVTRRALRTTTCMGYAQPQSLTTSAPAFLLNPTSKRVVLHVTLPVCKAHVLRILVDPTSPDLVYKGRLERWERKDG